MKRVLITIGAPVGNMGSQAMVRGTVYNVRKVYDDAYCEVLANDKEFEDSDIIEGINKRRYRYSIRGDKINWQRIVNKLYRMVSGKSSQGLKMWDFRKDARRSDLVIIIGGDNYDKSYNSLSYMNDTNQFVGEIGKEKCVLYNCSVSEEDLSEKVIKDISRFKYITARDSISYSNLKKALPNKDVRFYPDVAFCMKPEIVPLPDGWEHGKMIGINLSSLVADGRYGVNEDEVLNAYYKMIDYIINDTDLKICFIPHVKKNADLVMLRKLYDHVEDKSRAILIDHENFNAAQKKYIISQCRLFVGARTHSTIAAYSTMVPTLVIGYSVKSIGIATDLFGTDKGNVVPVAELKNSDGFLETFKNFLAREGQMKKQLELVIPDYIKKAEGVQELIKEIVK